MAIVKKKLWKEYFHQYEEGKKYELRLNDFNIQTGDTLILEEWDKEKQEYTGRMIERKVTRVNRFKLDWIYKVWPKEEVEEKGIQIISIE